MVCTFYPLNVAQALLTYRLCAGPQTQMEGGTRMQFAQFVHCLQVLAERMVRGRSSCTAAVSMLSRPLCIV